MSNKIQAYTSYEDGIHYYRDFEIEEEIYEVEGSLEELIKKDNVGDGVVIDVTEIDIDCEQGRDEVFDYDFYTVTIADIERFKNSDEEDEEIEDYMYNKYIAVKKLDLYEILETQEVINKKELEFIQSFEDVDVEYCKLNGDFCEIKLLDNEEIYILKYMFK